MDLYLILCGKRDRMLSVFEDFVDLMNYIDNCNHSKYLENKTEADLNEQEDGKYSIADEDRDTVTVYKIKTKVSEGYIYNSTYKKTTIVNKYKIVGE
jgi:hypothetical protein